MKKLLREPDQPVTFFNIQRYLKPHYPVSAKDNKEVKVVLEPPAPVRQPGSTSLKEVVPDDVVVEEAPKEVKPPVKKRVVRKAKD